MWDIEHVVFRSDVMSFIISEVVGRELLAISILYISRYIFFCVV